MHRGVVLLRPRYPIFLREAYELPKRHVVQRYCLHRQDVTSTQPCSSTDTVHSARGTWPTFGQSPPRSVAPTLSNELAAGGVARTRSRAATMVR
jgi:hypothetical protein